VEPEEVAIARCWAGKHASVAVDMHASSCAVCGKAIIMRTIGESVGSQRLAVICESVVTVCGWLRACRNLHY
jgi:hypothetical protein